VPVWFSVLGGKKNFAILKWDIFQFWVSLVQLFDTMLFEKVAVLKNCV